MFEFENEEDRVERDIIHLIQNIFNVICTGDKVSACIATSTLEFQRFINIYNNIDLFQENKSENFSENLTGFERELLKRALNVDKDMLEKAFEVAPLHIKEKMIHHVNIQLVLKSNDPVLIDYALDYILDNELLYEGIKEDITTIMKALKNDNKKINKENLKKKESMIEKINFILEDVNANPLIIRNKM